MAMLENQCRFQVNKNQLDTSTSQEREAILNQMCDNDCSGNGLCDNGKFTILLCKSML